MDGTPAAGAGPQPRHRIDILVVQPTPFCNLDCAYCYLPHRTDRRRMSTQTLRRTLESVFASGFVGDRLTLAWHAGEPLVLSRRYYEEAFTIAESLRPAGVTLTHSIQTNATTLDGGWAAFLRDHGVQVGVSLDGPQHLHDARRRTRGGGGSFERTMKGVRALQAAGTPFHVICVLSDASLQEPDALFDFFVGHDIRRVGFNIDEQEGANGRSSLDRPGVDRRFRAFLRRMLGRIRRSSPGTLTVREFEGAVAAILGDGVAGRPEALHGNPQTVPFRLTAVDVDGNLSTFSPELLDLRHPHYGDFRLGNVHRHALADIATGSPLARLAADIAIGTDNCRAICPYFALCGGGAPANKLYETGTFAATETLYCRLTTKAVVDVVLEEMEAAVASRPLRLRPSEYAAPWAARMNELRCAPP
jgi:uncharacterized protein